MDEAGSIVRLRNAQVETHASPPKLISIHHFSHVHIFTKSHRELNQQCKPSKKVNDLEAELKKTLKEKNDAISIQNFRRVNMDKVLVFFKKK